MRVRPPPPGFGAGGGAGAGQGDARAFASRVEALVGLRGIRFTLDGKNRLVAFVAGGLQRDAQAAADSIADLADKIADVAVERESTTINAGIWQIIKSRLCPLYPWC